MRLRAVQQRGGVPIPGRCRCLGVQLRGVGVGGCPVANAVDHKIKQLQRPPGFQPERQEDFHLRARIYMSPPPGPTGLPLCDCVRTARSDTKRQRSARRWTRPDWRMQMGEHTRRSL